METTFEVATPLPICAFTSPLTALPSDALARWVQTSVLISFGKS